MRGPSAFGVDLITFFEPTFWGQETADALKEKALSEPKWFWDGMLDALAEAGIGQIELTFAPADFRTGATAYGSLEGLAAELTRRNIRVVSSYLGDLEAATEIETATSRTAILNAAAATSAALAALGGAFLVLGLPMRTNNADQTGFEPVDEAAAQPIASLLDEIGVESTKHGITTAIHTESHSVLWTADDIDLFLRLTDPSLVSLCLDTGHVVLGGGDPIDVALRHRDRFALAHWKDATGPIDKHIPVSSGVFVQHRPFFRTVGAGSIDWRAWLETLAEIGFDGCFLLELDAAADPVAELMSARTHVTTLLATRSR